MGQRSAWSRIELVRALVGLRRERTRGTVAYYGVLAAFLLLVASVPVCGSTQDVVARGQHLRPSSPATWVVGQVVPKMYSFGHRVWLGTEPPEGFGRGLWINHYPGRLVRFESNRPGFVARAQDVYLLVRSGYHGRRWVSRFVVHPRDGGLVVEAQDAAP